MRRFIQACGLAGAVFASAAIAQDAQQQVLQPGMRDLKTKAWQAMPMEKGPIAVETENTPGLMFISPDGRWAWSGTLIDTWNGRAIKSVADLRDDMRRVNFSQLLGPNYGRDLDPFIIGSGPKKVQVFVDPKCKACSKLYPAMAELSSQYTFELMVVPMLGKESDKATRQLACARDRKIAQQALSSESSTDKLEQAQKCDLVSLTKRMMVAKELGLRGVPFIIAPDGRVSPGRPPNLGSFLAGA
jgi:thiol:disulfide interchange protein DsbC